MKVELLIYIYIAICVSMILYNIVYVFVLRERENALRRNAEKFKRAVFAQTERIEQGDLVEESHKQYLKKTLQKTWGITAFDKALEEIDAAHHEDVEEYLVETYEVFEYLTHKYLSKDTLKIAYFPYVLYKYDILKNRGSEQVREILFELLRSRNVYCRENTLKAVYSMQDAASVARALKIIDQNLSFHHPKLICDGLLTYKGDREALRDALLAKFAEYSIPMRVNILNFFRFGNIRCDETMLEFLQNEKQNCEIHFSCIRYFEKFPCESARKTLEAFAENADGHSWEYQAIATSALKSYPGDVTFRILVKNLSNSNWHVRQNSAISCEKLGYTYQELINVFDGEDRYAREILRYHLDHRNVKERA